MEGTVTLRDDRVTYPPKRRKGHRRSESERLEREADGASPRKRPNHQRLMSVLPSSLESEVSVVEVEEEKSMEKEDATIRRMSNRGRSRQSNVHDKERSSPPAALASSNSAGSPGSGSRTGRPVSSCSLNVVEKSQKSASRPPSGMDMDVNANNGKGVEEDTHMDEEDSDADAEGDEDDDEDADTDQENAKEAEADTDQDSENTDQDKDRELNEVGDFYGKRPFTFISPDEFDYTVDYDREPLFGVSGLRKLGEAESFIELSASPPVALRKETCKKAWKKYYYKDRHKVALVVGAINVPTIKELDAAANTNKKRPSYMVLWANGAYTWANEIVEREQKECAIRLDALAHCQNYIKGPHPLPVGKVFEARGPNRHQKLAALEYKWNVVLKEHRLARLYLMNTITDDLSGLSMMDFTYLTENHHSKDVLTLLAAGDQDRVDGSPAQTKCNCKQGSTCDAKKCTCSSGSGRGYANGGLSSTVNPDAGFVVECGEGCGCKANCLRNLLQRGRTYPLVLCKESTKIGWGLRASADIPEGAFVGEMTGEVITLEEADNRSSVYQMGLKNLDQTEDYAVLDAGTMGNEMRYANHSCDPNCVVLAVYSSSLRDQMSRIGIFATKNIAKGEPITYNYYRDMDEEAIASHQSKDLISCLCGASNCMKFMPTVLAYNETPEKKKTPR